MHRYCLPLPEGCDTAAEILEALKDPEHMDTNGKLGAGTKVYFRNDAEGTLEYTHPVYGKLWAGLMKFLEDKGLLNEPIPWLNPPVATFFKSQGAGGEEPASNPCDVFDYVAAGADVTVFVGWWDDENSTNNGDGTKANPGDRAGGHMITIVGAVKCGEEVTIFYRDDSHGGDAQGDGKADEGAKSAKFVPGGASGWSIFGGRWEGFVAITPSVFTAPLAEIKEIDEKLEPAVTSVERALALGGQPLPEDLKTITKSGLRIRVFSQQL